MGEAFQLPIRGNMTLYRYRFCAVLIYSKSALYRPTHESNYGSILLASGLWAPRSRFDRVSSTYHEKPYQPCSPCPRSERGKYRPGGSHHPRTWPLLKTTI